MNIFKVDDGAYHWVIAENEADAIDVWQHEMLKMGMTDEDLGLDEPPEAIVLTEDDARGTLYHDADSGALLGTMWSEYERDPSRRYVGGSEF